MNALRRIVFFTRLVFRSNRRNERLSLNEAWGITGLVWPPGRKLRMF